ncbi:hypothetical protein NXC12_CH03299 [Rhizobium etli]|uniref:Uncharacterized protein n=1 Tax=Rhizobium etli TaxID=29449 RepID=A0AAN1BHA6_RHIET|nr:hypothetical protein [Rhizobium etli]ARQ11283.1 hypothetical protein NXC12_CH03299 [Rhizobium etli]
MEVCFAGARHLLVLHVAKVFLASRAKNRDQITAAAEANEVLRRMGATLGHIQDIHYSLSAHTDDSLARLNVVHDGLFTVDQLGGRNVCNIRAQVFATMSPKLAST